MRRLVAHLPVLSRLVIASETLASCRPCASRGGTWRTEGSGWCWAWRWWRCRRGAPGRGRDAGPPDAGVLTEVGVSRTNAGFAVETGGPEDAGVAQPVFLAPTLLADSPAALPAAARRRAGDGHGAPGAAGGRGGRGGERHAGAGRAPAAGRRPRCTPPPGLRFSPAKVDGAAGAGAPWLRVPLRGARVAEGPTEAHAPAPRPVTLKGLVREKGNRRPLPGAVLVSDAAPDAPVETDAEGRFEARLALGRAEGARDGARPQARRLPRGRCARARRWRWCTAWSRWWSTPTRRWCAGTASARRCRASRCTTRSCARCPAPWATRSAW